MGGGWTSSQAAQQRRDLLVASAGAGDADEDQALVEDALVPSRRDSGRRLCWVVLDDVDPMPGVVAAWERNKGGAWRARVAYVLDETGTVATGWLPASCLRPHGSSPPAPRPPTD